MKTDQTVKTTNREMERLKSMREGQTFQLDPCYNPEMWEEIWKLAGLHKNPEQSKYGEVWQYMGSKKLKCSSSDTIKVQHDFRHRKHPETGSRLYRKVIQYIEIK